MLDRTKISAIIFDLGGVIINIDPMITLQAMQQLNFTNLQASWERLNKEGFFHLYETGKINDEEFISTIRKEGEGIPSESIANAWNALVLDIPEERIQLIRELKNYHRLFLLSNTNSLHMEAVNAHVKERFGMENLAPLFEKDYYSHEINLRKPNREIFEFVLNENDLVAEETLFIDDTAEHIESAKSLGIQTHHLKAPETILTLFSGVLPN